jgi:hypothetical protein
MATHTIGVVSLLVFNVDARGLFDQTCHRG